MSTQCSPQKSRAVPLRWFTTAAAASLGICALAALRPGSAGASPLPSGPVDVLSAGSLQDLLQEQVGPAFERATGVKKLVTVEGIKHYGIYYEARQRAQKEAISWFDEHLKR